jgi:phage gp46-like protein
MGCDVEMPKFKVGDRVLCLTLNGVPVWEDGDIITNINLTLNTPMYLLERRGWWGEDRLRHEAKFWQKFIG